MAIKAEDVKKLRDKTGAGMLDCKKALEEAQGNFDEAETILKKMGLAAVAKRVERGTSEGRIFTHAGKTRIAIVELGCETDFVARNEEFVRTGEAIAKEAAEKKLSVTDAGLLQSITNIAATIKENITLRRLELIDIAADEVVDTYLHGDAASVGVVVKAKIGGSIAGNADVKTFLHDCALHAAAFKPQFLKPEAVGAAYIATQEEIFAAQVASMDKPEQVKKGITAGKIKKHLQEICFLEQAFVKDDKLTVAQKAQAIGKAAGGTVEITDYRVYTKGEAIA